MLNSFIGKAFSFKNIPHVTNNRYIRNPTYSLGFAIAQPNLQKMAKVLLEKPAFLLLSVIRNEWA
jgi:hypothetical protein